MTKKSKPSSEGASAEFEVLRQSATVGAGVDWQDVMPFRNMATMTISINSILELRIFACFKNGITCTSALGRAVSEKLNYLKGKRDLVSTSDEDRKKIDAEVEILLGKDHGKAWDTVKANLVDMLLRFQVIRDEETNEKKKKEWADRCKELEKLINDLNKEKRPE